MPEIQIVDMQAPIAAIKKKYGERYYRNPNSFKEAAELWGFENYNAGGVITDHFEENIVEVNSCKAAVQLAESSKGYWLMEISASPAISGYASRPAVFDSIGYESYEDALLAGTQKIERFFQRELISKNSCSSNSNKRNIAEALKLIEETRTNPELDLFDLPMKPQNRGGSNVAHR